MNGFATEKSCDTDARKESKRKQHRRFLLVNSLADTGGKSAADRGSIRSLAGVEKPSDTPPCLQIHIYGFVVRSYRDPLQLTK